MTGVHGGLDHLNKWAPDHCKQTKKGAAKQRAYLNSWKIEMLRGTRLSQPHNSSPHHSPTHGGDSVLGPLTFDCNTHIASLPVLITSASTQRCSSTSSSSTHTYCTNQLLPLANAPYQEQRPHSGRTDLLRRKRPALYPICPH